MPAIANSKFSTQQIEIVRSFRTLYRGESVRGLARRLASVPQFEGRSQASIYGLVRRIVGDVAAASGATQTPAPKARPTPAEEAPAARC